MDKDRPYIGVATFLMKPNGQFLIGHRTSKNGNGTWGLTGGHVEYGESPLDAAIRETEEEAGIVVKSAGILNITNSFFKESGKHYITVFYLAEVPQNTTAELREPDKFSEWRWIHHSQLPENTFLPLTQSLRDLEEKGRLGQFFGQPGRRAA